MKLNDDPKPPIRCQIPGPRQPPIIPVVLHQLLQQIHNDVKLAAGMGPQYRRVAASRNGCRVNDDTAQHLGSEYRFVHWTGATVEPEYTLEDRRRQGSDYQIASVYRGREKGLDEAVAETAAVKGEGADARQSTTDVCVATHNAAKLVLAGVSPIGFHEA